MSKIIITGGAGFIGSNLAEELVKQKHQVVVLDNLFSGRLANLRNIKSKIRFVRGDVRSLPFLRKNFKGIDYVFHLAAMSGVSLSMQKPQESNAVNIDGTLNVFLAARDSKVKRVVFASSASVYGMAFAINKEEQNLKPLSPYATGKAAGEYYARNFFELFGLPTVSLRFFNVFGPRQNPDSQYAAVIPLFIKLALSNKTLTVDGDGGQSRDFTFVSNVAQAMILAMDVPKAAGEAINIACGDSITVNQLVQVIGKTLGKKLKVVHGKPRPGDIYRSRADISKAKRLLGFKPQVDFEAGMKKTIDSLK